jgi:tRNA(Ile2) C34 agmatinyltransferase TiaS
VCNEKIFVSSVPICPECRIEFSVSQEWAGFLKKKYWICKKCKKKSSFSTRRLSDIYTTVRREFEKKISEQI